MYFNFITDASQYNDVSDIAFLVDSSGSWGRTRYAKQLEFVKDTMTKLANNSTKLSAALVLYSTSASVQLNFSQIFSLKNFLSTVDSLSWERGLTRMDKA